MKRCYLCSYISLSVCLLPHKLTTMCGEVVRTLVDKHMTDCKLGANAARQTRGYRHKTPSTQHFVLHTHLTLPPQALSRLPCCLCSALSAAVSASRCILPYDNCSSVLLLPQISHVSGVRYFVTRAPDTMTTMNLGSCYYHSNSNQRPEEK